MKLLRLAQYAFGGAERVRAARGVCPHYPAARVIGTPPRELAGRSLQSWPIATLLADGHAHLNYGDIAVLSFRNRGEFRGCSVEQAEFQVASNM